jgi:rhodanese-related sulfurtransferase
MRHPAAMKTIDHREVLALQARGAQIIETLPPSEYNTTHIKGALHLPLRDVMRKAAATLVRERPVIAYCRDTL